MLNEQRIQSFPESVEQWYMDNDQTTICKREYSSPTNEEAPAVYVNYTTDEGLMYV